MRERALRASLSVSLSLSLLPLSPRKKRGGNAKKKNGKSERRKKHKRWAKNHFFLLLSPASSSPSFQKREDGEMGDFVDHELLLSVASGIGRWVDGPAGAVYERDEDCLGKEKKKEVEFSLLLMSFDFDDAEKSFFGARFFFRALRSLCRASLPFHYSMSAIAIVGAAIDVAKLMNRSALFDGQRARHSDLRHDLYQESASDHHGESKRKRNNTFYNKGKATLEASIYVLSYNIE